MHTSSTTNAAPQSKRKTQRSRIVALLIAAKDSWVPLPEVMRCGGAQYNARILELRQIGFPISNRIEVVDGVRHSWYRLELTPSELLFQARYRYQAPRDGQASVSDERQRLFAGLRPGAKVN